MSTPLEKKIENIRAQIATAKETLDAASEALVQPERAKEAAAEWVDLLADEAGIDPGEFAHRSPDIPEALNRSEYALNLIAWLDGDRLKKKLFAGIDAFYKDHQGAVDGDDTVASAPKLRKRLFELEVEEERLIQTAESQGLVIHRRADADPEAILEA